MSLSVPFPFPSLRSLRILRLDDSSTKQDRIHGHGTQGHLFYMRTLTSTLFNLRKGGILFGHLDTETLQLFTVSLAPTVLYLCQIAVLIDDHTEASRRRVLTTWRLELVLQPWWNSMRPCSLIESAHVYTSTEEVVTRDVSIDKSIHETLETTC